MKKALFIFSAALAAAFAASAAELAIMVNGRLQITGSSKAGGVKKIEFRLYDGKDEDAAALWGRTVAVTCDSDNRFETVLSDSSGSAIIDMQDRNMADAVRAGGIAGKQLYVGLTMVGADEEFGRQKIYSVPYSQTAFDADNSNGDFVVAGVAEVVGGVRVKGDLLAGYSVVATNENNKLGGYGAAPVGTVIIWTQGEPLPKGWRYCNGNGWSPDLRGRFLVGYRAGDEEYGTFRATGGKAEVELTDTQLPAHSHTYMRADAEKPYVREGTGGRHFEDAMWPQNYSQNDKYHSHDVEETGPGGGEGAAHNNLPPYYVVDFIVRYE